MISPAHLALASQNRRRSHRTWR